MTAHQENLHPPPPGEALRTSKLSPSRYKLGVSVRPVDARNRPGTPIKTRAGVPSKRPRRSLGPQTYRTSKGGYVTLLDQKKNITRSELDPGKEKTCCFGSPADLFAVYSGWTEVREKERRRKKKTPRNSRTGKAKK